MYSGCIRLISFEIRFILKEIRRAEHEYLNVTLPPSINALATVGVKRMSPVDTELLFIILYNIIALQRNTNIFFLWKSSNLNK